MLYQLHEFQRALLSPLTAWAQATSKSFANPASPLAYVPGATRLSAGYELLYRLGKNYEKPRFNLHQIVKASHNIPNQLLMQRVPGEVQAATDKPPESGQLMRIAPPHQELINLRGTPWCAVSIRSYKALPLR